MQGTADAAAPISKTDVEAIRDRITGCQELAHSIRGKAFQLNGREGAKESDKKDTRETAGDVGQELKEKLSDLRELLNDAFNSLSAFV